MDSAKFIMRGLSRVRRRIRQVTRRITSWSSFDSPAAARRSARSSTSSSPTRALRRDGRFIERVGFYNPVASGAEQPLRVAFDRVEHWTGHGAQMSPTVKRLVEQAKPPPPERRRRRGVASQRRPRRASTPRWPADALEVGRIVDAWGVKGWFKVQPYAVRPQALRKARRWHLQPPEDAVARRRPARRCRARSRSRETRWHGDWLVARATGHRRPQRRRGAARRAHLRVAVELSRSRDADEFYWVDLIGLRRRQPRGRRRSARSSACSTPVRTACCGVASRGRRRRRRSA